MAHPPTSHSDDRIIAAFSALRSDEFVGLRLYQHIATQCVERPELFRALHHSQAGQARPVLWLASIHDLLLAGSPHPLGEWYPTISADPRDPSDPALAATLADFVDAHADALATSCASRTTQTNEVNRSAWWMMLMRHPLLGDTPEVSILELGASAGLNLCFDRFSLTLDHGTTEQAFGEAESTVALRTEVRGTESIDWATTAPRIVERAGVDAAPIAADDTEQLRWLQACVWPEQTTRTQRFDAALDVVAATRPTVERGDALDDLASLCERFDPTRPLVVFNSWVLTYIERSRRQDIWSILDDVGADRELWWWSLEAPGCIDGIDTPPDTNNNGGTSLGAVTHWGDGMRRTAVVARMHPHLQWCEPLAHTMS